MVISFSQQYSSKLILSILSPFQSRAEKFWAPGQNKFRPFCYSDQKMSSKIVGWRRKFYKFIPLRRYFRRGVNHCREISYTFQRNSIVSAEITKKSYCFNRNLVHLFKEWFTPRFYKTFGLRYFVKSSLWNRKNGKILVTDIELTYIHLLEERWYDNLLESRLGKWREIL